MRLILGRSISLGLLLPLIGCSGALREARQTIAELRMAIDTLGQNMVRAADALDPLAVKELYRDVRNLDSLNAELRDLIEETENLQAFPYRIQLYGCCDDIHFAVWLTNEQGDSILVAEESSRWHDAPAARATYQITNPHFAFREYLLAGEVRGSGYYTLHGRVWPASAIASVGGAEIGVYYLVNDEWQRVSGKKWASGDPTDAEWSVPLLVAPARER